MRAVVCAVLCAGIAYGKGIPQARPVWSTDLHQVGFFPSAGFQFSLTAHSHRTESLIGEDSVAFGRRGHIGVIFLNKGIDGRDRSGSSAPEAAELHLVVLDS